MMSLPKLMRELQIIEGIKDAKGIHMVVKNSFGFSYNKKKKILSRKLRKENQG